jgi:hypothetical protein
MSFDSVIEVFSFILPLYYPSSVRRGPAPNYRKRTSKGWGRSRRTRASLLVIVVLWLVVKERCFSCMLAPHCVVLAGKDPVQIGCGADQRQMREGLWEVAEMLAAWTNLFRVEPQMVGVS